MSVRRIRSGIKEEEEQEMVGGNSNSTTVRGYKRQIKKEEESYSKRCKRSTPKEKMDIYGFLYMDESKNSIFVCAREDGRGIETCKLKNFNLLLGTGTANSCNGLMLRFEIPFCYAVSTIIYRVENVLTGQAVSLPHLRFGNPWNGASGGIGYAFASMKYKVVVPHCLEEKEGLSVLTAGVDVSWRSVCVDHLSPLGMKMLVSCSSICTEGFVHWAAWRRRGAPFGCAVLTFDIETEVIMETLPPVEIKSMNYRFLSTGKYLSLFVMVTKLVWQVFEMKPDTLEWTRLPDMCLEGLGLTDDVDFVISCWLKYPEVVCLCLRVERDLIFYSFITRKIGAEKLSTCKTWALTIPHKNTLQDLPTTNK